jgi:hypothetical protein
MPKLFPLPRPPNWPIRGLYTRLRLRASNTMWPRRRCVMGGARQGRRERRYAGISARLRTPHRAAQDVPATQSFIVLEALSAYALSSASSSSGSAVPARARRSSSRARNAFASRLRPSFVARTCATRPSCTAPMRSRRRPCSARSRSSVIVLGARPRVCESSPIVVDLCRSRDSRTSRSRYCRGVSPHARTTRSVAA